MITYRSPVSKEDFESYYELRWRILRKPWAQPKGSEQVETDKDSYHILAEIDDKVIGVGCIHEIEDGVGRIRFMAVDDDYQKQGIGETMVDLLEKYTIEQKWNKVLLYAREIAVNFYLKLGYKIIDNGEPLFGVINHKIMEKEI